MASTAFTLREEYVGAHPGTDIPIFTGGVVAVGDSDVDIRELLDEGDGIIVINEASDADLIRALDEYPALKRTTVDEAAEITVGYDDHNATELRAELKRRGITGAGSTSKPDAIAALEHFDVLAEAGTNVADGTSITDLLGIGEPGTTDDAGADADAGDGHDDQEGAQ